MKLVFRPPWVAVAAIAAACSLNPQPEPPGGDEPANAGGTGTGGSSTGGTSGTVGGSGGRGGMDPDNDGGPTFTSDAGVGDHAAPPSPDAGESNDAADDDAAGLGDAAPDGSGDAGTDAPGDASDGGAESDALAE